MQGVIITLDPGEAVFAEAGAMIAIMDRWSLDGRNPNSYSGYFWTLGRYDRPWPERPIFGVIRYMSSANTARKLKVKNYVEEFAPESGTRQLPLSGD